jgi:anti-repressor protein
MYGISLKEERAAEKFYTMSEAAKIIGIKDFGRNKLLDFLRSERIMTRRNEPYQAYIDQGYFKFVIKDVINRKGWIIDRPPVSLVSEKGINWIKNLLNKKDENEE